MNRESSIAEHKNDAELDLFEFESSSDFNSKINA